ncbi:hypothetical protein PPERSA_08058 [Pseudocohnilembus persalinus]|uniref:Ubiquitin carboxyl-terminal hydrolase n=1 Tax=Pseudocohnilembus persalinus TaxID=266149 RepID=A0A0V0R2P3_PSEPJ|nr:hypothetical protein PPERSA_08058 [Pseudocohnilembus persalinus]|eukprot:KRX08747.1 hypothetical protein PPERSA_08058 [Pseudocohnilembus persalinus]
MMLKLVQLNHLLKPDTDLNNIGLKDKSTVVLMGAAEGMSIEDNIKPEQQQKFIEDMTPQEIAKLYKEKTGRDIPCGLINLGNTCYMNSCLQSFKRINELKDYLLQNQIPSEMTQEHQVTKAMQNLVGQMNQTGQAVKPYQFLTTLFNAFPQFAEQSHGSFKQQDADECFTAIQSCLERATPYKDSEGKQSQLIKDLFEIPIEVELKNLDNNEEPPVIKEDIQKKLMCQIEAEPPTNNMIEGLKSALVTQVEKLSELDNQNHLYSKVSKIKKLPSYLAIQMQRFLWKDAVQIAGSKASSVKILRSVAFPRVLDVYPLCTEELQKSLDMGREYEQKQKEENDKKKQDAFDHWKKEQEEKNKNFTHDSKVQWKLFKESQNELEIKQHDEQLYRAHGQGLDAGNYELVAVITHQGRSSEEGHYMSWIHSSGDDWLKFDDDVVTEVKTEDIMQLKGGGDWHMGYYFFYRKIELL